MRNQSGMTTLLLIVVLGAAGYAFINTGGTDSGGSLSGIESADEFSDGIAGSEVAGPELVLVKFGATWCPPCRAIDAELAELKTSHADQVKVIKVDVDDYPDLANQYNVNSIPRLLMFCDGEVVGDRTGFFSHAQLVQWLDVCKPGTASSPTGMIRANPFSP